VAQVYPFPVRRRRSGWVARFDDGVGELDRRLSRVADQLDAATAASRAAVAAARTAFRAEWGRRELRPPRAG
jgi:hypothetical protein